MNKLFLYKKSYFRINYSVCSLNILYKVILKS